MGNDYIYWTFSAAAQSISAFVAFFLTGYALVHTLMDAAREKDDSLDEIHAALRITYHKRLKILAWLTGSAIILSLVVVYLNRANALLSIWIVAPVAIVNLAAVILGLAFVISIIDPIKYQKAAKKVLEEEKPAFGPGAAQTSAADFFVAFTHLEKIIRDYLRKRKLYIPSRGAPRMSYSFRQMIDALLQNEVIRRDFYDELMEINKYRNLVFHGHVEKADRSMLDRVRNASIQAENLNNIQQTWRDTSSEGLEDDNPGLPDDEREDNG